MVAESHRSLCGRFPGLLTIIVPRHPERGDAIRAHLSTLGLKVAQRSRSEIVDGGTDVYVADTFGELGLFYRVAPIAFLGGSLIPHGGQNPIEPVRLGCAVLHGPHVHNFSDIYAIIDAVGSPKVAGATDLADALAALLADPTAARRQASAMADALKPLSGALIATMAELDPYLRRGATS
jgi:3-deoxy-D-manno-octulosonic-acid transferase